MTKTRTIFLTILFLCLTVPGRAQISDVSDAVFSIVVPSAEARVVDMGVLPVGTQRDSLVQPFVRNTGRARIRIDALYITGTDAGAFDVIAGKAPTFVPVGEGHGVGFSFLPTTPGVKTATIVVETQIDTQYYAIRGEATAPQIALDVMMVDFGQIPVGAHRDSTLVLVRNLTAGPVTVSDAAQAGPDMLQFSVVTGQAPFFLAPFGTQEMTVRYEARKGGRSSGSIVFTVEGSPDQLTAQLFGEGIVRDATATLATDTLTAAPGEIVRIPIRLREAKDVQFTGASAFTTELRYHASLLVPFGATPQGRLEGTERVIPLDNLPLMPDADGVLDWFDFMAVLGDAQTTPLRLENSAAIGAGFPVLESPGMFRLTDICREGGDRLFDASAVLQLSQSGPNPFNAATVINFQTIEKGHVSLFVLDLLGRRVRTLVDEALEPGAHQRILDLQEYPSGSYLCVMQTATAQRMIRLQLLK
ncbi:MAG: choice-of-anchor D domain-containing protein [Bacteroidetes bacterium]|nr:choice-of-anchor D domain-containing protein [Bacteroidota bacterium]